MMAEHTVSRDSANSLDVISNAIIKETFLSYAESGATVKGAGNENSLSINKTQESSEEHSECCSDACFKWWFFHSSFQIPTKGDIKTDLLNQRKQFYCCDVCSGCLEIKLLNYCASTKCMKEHCSECFYNGCQLSCCCFTFILSSK
jgi:hypothetical protein